MNTLIIGGGAAGFAAAITAARKGDRVTVLERTRKPLRKLGVTGNGRGNLMNLGDPQYFGDEAFARAVVGAVDVWAFLQSIGIALTEEDEGRVYPASYLAASAVDAMLQMAKALSVRVECNVRAVRIERGFAVHAKRAKYAPDITLKSGRTKPGELLGEEDALFHADKVIVTVGGAASPIHGTDGSAYGLLTDLGHRLIPPRPALTALLTPPVEGMSGQRVRATLILDGEYISQGEALFTDDGVSGIAAMQLSRFVQPGSELTIDLREAIMGKDRHKDVENWLQSRRHLPQLLTGAASPALCDLLMKRSQGDIRQLATLMVQFKLPVLGVRDFASAQVTAGGIDPAAFDASTLESRLIPGLFAAGEVLNVDGACGGFNLMFAFASGVLAGA